jgi:elongation factor G
MSVIRSEDIRNIAVVGHKGSGKTSLVEAMLYVAKVAPRRGKPGDRSCGLDDSPEEKAHMATLESRLVTLPWRDKKINLIDTPGEASLLADTRLALSAVDTVILVVSAKSGVETGTERLCRWSRELHIPCLVVITKMDDEHAVIDEVMTALHGLKLPLASMEVATGSGASFKGVAAVQTGKAWIGKPEAPGAADPAEPPSELKNAVTEARAKLVDDVAATDDLLTDKYLTDGDLTQEDFNLGARKAVAAGKLVPMYFASSSVPIGVAALMDALVDLAPSPLDRAPWKGISADKQQVERAPVPDGPLAAMVFKTHIDPHAGKTSVVRVLSGTLRPDMQVLCSNSGQRERVAQLLQGTGKELKPLAEAVAGEMAFATKLRNARTGDTLTDEKHPFTLTLPNRPPPLYSRSVQVAKGSEEKVAIGIQRLIEEDPGLSFSHQEESRELILAGLGAMQLEITVERLRRRTGIDCKLGPPRIPYRETVTRKVANVEGKQKKQTGGHGQFGVCYVDLEPLPRGSGFEFEDAIVGGVIPRQFIPSVEKGVTRGILQGVLAGYPVVDVRVRLVDGKYHSVDSSDAAFQVAGWRAFRAAAAAAHPVLLEPIVKIEVTVPSESMGDVVGDLNSRHGKVLSTNLSGDTTTTIIAAYLPLSQTLDYEPILTGMTRGRGTFTVAFDHYDFCSPPVQEKIVRESGFKALVEED